MPWKHARIDGKPRERFPNAKPGWDGCPMTCPDSCPYAECTMPPELAASLEPPHWHGWIVNEKGFTEMDTRTRKWSALQYEARGMSHG